jgi:Ni/Co efflux regulator RcnB
MRMGLWMVATVALLGASVSMAQDQGRRADDHSAPARPPSHARAPAHRPAPAPAFARRRPAHRFLSGGSWQHSVHASAFQYPSGYAYRVWTTGAVLPSIFLASPYFYDDYGTLGLGAPPRGYRWVRYGPDLVLVNVVTGRIADVVEGVFY